MLIEEATARALGWPKLTYAALERERRFLCHRVPREQAIEVLRITDRYVTGSRLRLREMVPLAGGEPAYKLTRKSDVDDRTRLLTTIYLAPGEFDMLSALPATMLRKTRYRLGAPAGISLSVDQFEGPLEGLVLAEAELPDAAALQAYPMPDFAVREVTGDPRYRGSALALNGAPG